ncbi:MAG TPA: DinB family protein [Ramlibacter sp.]|jgi:uncharacterized damage-inducible protein DinB
MSPDADHLHKLLRYSSWANALLYRCLADLDPGFLMQAKPGRPSGVLGILGHIYVIGCIWKAHLTGEGHGFLARNLDPLPSFAELRNRQLTLDRWYSDFARDLPAPRRDVPIEFRFVDGGPGVMTAQEMLLHVVNHGTYHRGYIAVMMYDAGLKPPTMDLPVFLRDEAGDRRTA